MNKLNKQNVNEGIDRFYNEQASIYSLKMGQMLPLHIDSILILIWYRIDLINIELSSCKHKQNNDPYLATETKGLGNKS